MKKSVLILSLNVVFIISFFTISFAAENENYTMQEINKPEGRDINFSIKNPNLSIEAYTSKTITKTFNCLFSNSVTNLEASIKVTGNYQFDIANENITKATVPIVVLTGYQGADLGQCYMNIKGATATINGGGTTVTFNTVVELCNADGNKYGKYTMSITGGSTGLVSIKPASGDVYSD